MRFSSSSNVALLGQLLRRGQIHLLSPTIMIIKLYICSLKQDLLNFCKDRRKYITHTRLKISKEDEYYFCSHYNHHHHHQSVTFKFRNFSVSKKVSDSVSEKIGIGKKFWIRFRSDFGFRHTLITTTINSIIIASIIFFKAREQGALLCSQPIVPKP